MPFASFDAAAVARCLAQIGDREGDLADAYFEWLEELELPGDPEAPGVVARREGGFAVRLLRRGETFLAARDGFDSRAFTEALRQVARTLPGTGLFEPRLDVRPPPEAPEALELRSFPAAVQREIRHRRAAFPLELTVRRHRRQIQVVGTRLVPEPEHEHYYSFSAALPWGRHGGLAPELDQEAAAALASSLVALFRARQAPPPEPCRCVVVLAPAASAVLLHEAVAHALESDTLILGGRPEAAVGLELGSAQVSVVDDPAGAPSGVRRATDDEGIPVVRRWLLREGRVEQPLADLLSARGSGSLIPGAGRRAGRFSAPAPRSSHLELLAGELGEEELLAEAEGGLFLPEASRGALDPLSGQFTLQLPYARRIRAGEPGEAVGPCRLVGRVAELLASIVGLGREARPAGAGWCAKGGQRLPVWATAPALRIENAEVAP